MAFLSNTNNLEGFEGTTIQTRHSTVKIDFFQPPPLIIGRATLLDKELLPDFDEMTNLIVKQEVILIREVELVGIIENYHTMWDGPNAQYPTAFVSPATAQMLLERGLMQSEVAENQAYTPPIHLFVASNGQEVINPPVNYFPNQLIVDDQAFNEARISQILLVTFGLVTAFSIFQIALVQLKKRQRKFALMRSIGATTDQTRSLMDWEAFYLLRTAMPVGVGLGVLISVLLIWLNNQLTSGNIQLVIQPGWLAIGLLTTLASALIGLFLPLSRLNRIPLRGQIEVVDSKQNRKTRDVIGDKEISLQSLSSINRRHYRFIRKQRWITTMLFSLILFILLSGLWLMYLSFEEYREEVLATDMPDFEFVRGYQQGNQYNRNMMDELAKIPRIGRMDLLTKGEKAFLWYDNIGDNFLSNYFFRMIPGAIIYDYYGTTTDYVIPSGEQFLTKEALLVDVFGIETNSQLGERLRQSLPSNFDWQAFENGESVVLASPGYQILEENVSEVEMDVAERFERTERMKEIFQLTKVAQLSYDYRRVPSMETEPTFDNLSMIRLTIPTGKTTTADQISTNEVLVHDLPVGATMHALPKLGLWPLSSTLQNPVVLLSKYQMEQLYPYRMSQAVSLQFSSFGTAHRSERYGNTLFHVYLDSPSEEEATEVKRIGYEYNFKVNSLYLVKDRLYAKGFQTSLIVGLLCLALLIITLQIQTTSFRGLLDTERSRIGILQSLGVRAQDYARTYLFDAIKRILLAVVITHGVLLVVILGYLFFVNPGSDILLELRISLADYPYLIHGLIVLGFTLLGILAAYWPLGDILKRQPVENIRSLN